MPEFEVGDIVLWDGTPTQVSQWRASHGQDPFEVIGLKDYGISGLHPLLREAQTGRLVRDGARAIHRDVLRRDEFLTAVKRAIGGTKPMRR